MNEPWFFVEGCLWALLALLALTPPWRRRWRLSAATVAVRALTLAVLSGLGVIPEFHNG